MVNGQPVGQRDQRQSTRGQRGHSLIHVNLVNLVNLVIVCPCFMEAVVNGTGLGNWFPYAGWGGMLVGMTTSAFSEIIRSLDGRTNPGVATP